MLNHHQDKSNKSRRLFEPLQNNRGVAIMVALFAMVFMLFIATQVSYDTQVEYVSSSQQVNDLKAFYAAKAGVELSLFRIKIYQQLRAQFAQQVESDPQYLGMLNQIWQFPFSWPPVVPETVNSVEKGKIEDTVKESAMDAQYTVSISAEGGKIDLNDLGSEIKELSEAARAQILQIFQNELDNNEEFRDKYQNENFEELVNNIADFVDSDTEGRNSAAENQGYETPDDSNVQLPPNRAFRSLDELYMVVGMNDEFFNLLKDRVTVHGTKGINPNEAPRKVLESLLPGIEEEDMKELLERRSSLEKGGPFTSKDDFYGFLDSTGYRTDQVREADPPLYFNAVYNFRVISTGKSANTRKEITVITFDYENLAGRYKAYIDTNKPPPDPPPTTPTPTPAPIPYKAPKGRPTVVYWEET